MFAMTPIVIPPVPSPPPIFHVPADLIAAEDVAAYTAAWQARDAAQTALIAQLEAPPVAGTAWGIDASNKSQHDTALSIFGPEPLRWRYYQQPGEPIAYPTEYTLRPGEGFVYGSKVKSPTVAAYVAMMSKHPKDVELIVTPWHEPENDIAGGAFTAAQYRSWFTNCRIAARQVGPHVKVAAILMGYTWDPASKRNVEDYIPADADFDYLLTDTYFAGSIGHAVSDIPTGFDATIATAQKHGKPWGVAETGIGQKVTGQARLDALTLLSKTIRQKGAVVGLYFATSPAGEWGLNLTDGSAAAWKAGQHGV